MDTFRFGILARSLTGRAFSSRRALLRGLAAALPLNAARISPGADAGKRKKPRPNEFGCLNVGQTCRGNDARCCSGICQGNKPKKGKKDKRRCVAHDTGSCTQEDAFCASGGSADAACGPTGACTCNTTTGRAPHCGGAAFCPAVECQRDADCGEDPGAACIPAAFCQGCGDPATQNFCQRRCGS